MKAQRTYHGHLFRMLALFVSATSIALLVGCDLTGGLGGQIGNATDKAVAALNEAIEQLSSESGNWRIVLEATRDKLIEEGHTIVANDVSLTLNRAIGTTAVETFCGIDFIRTRVLQDIVRIRDKLLGQATSAPEPVVCDTNPPGIKMAYVPEHLNLLEFYGYDLDSGDIHAFLEQSDGAIEITSYLRLPSHFHMTLNLGTNGVPLSGNSNAIVVRYGDTLLSSVSVQQAPPPPTPTPQPSTCYWTSHTSEEYEPAMCSSGYAVKGMRCEHDYCDNVYLFCCSYMPDRGPDPMFSPVPAAPISEEPSNNRFEAPGFLVGLGCEHDYCDNVTAYWLNSPNLPNLGQCGFRPYFSEEGANSDANESICEAGFFAAGLGCEHDYCDKMTLMCCKTIKE